MSSTSISDDTPVEATVGVDAVGPDVLARAGLSRIDYVDHFAIGPVDGTAATPEQWARILFGDVPSVPEWFIWRVLLQLRLRKGRSRSAVAGWPIVARGEDWVRLETSSWTSVGVLVVRATEQELSLTTYLRYDRPFGAVVWGRLSAVHRRLSPGMLRDAVSTVAERRQSATR